MPATCNPSAGGTATRRAGVLCARALLPMFLVVPLAASAPGCGGNARVAVQGEVTLAGQPLVQGGLVFEPLDAGVATGAEISRGRYAIAAAQGPMPGKYRVRVTGYEPTGREVEDTDFPGKMSPEMKQVVPLQYNEWSEFTVEIPPGGGGVDIRLP